VPVGNTNLPFIMNVFDLQHRTHPWFPELSSESEWQGREDYYKRYLPRALAIITGTQRGKDEIQKMYGVDENNIYIIPHVTSKNSKSETGVTSILRVGPYIYPAQFWSHKNHKVIVEAVKIIRNSLRAQIKVNFIGEDKGNLNYIKRIVNEYGLSEQIKFLGFVSNEIKNNLYKESRGLIYSSFSGPENLPPLEAFDIGIPVIYSDFPGAREQLGDYPFYFDPSSPMSLVNAIQQLEDVDKVQMAKRLEDQKLFVENRRPSNFLISFVKIITGVEFMVNSWDKRDSSKF
jgi:glycosyltransferase involved in cell wall biosynthesis